MSNQGHSAAGAVDRGRVRSLRELLSPHPRIIAQGITGRQGRLELPWMLQSGTEVVAGVTPGRGGAEVAGVPVYDSVLEALSGHQCAISMCYVPGQAACDAAAEAVEAGIELVVMGAEDVPVHDMARLVKLAAGAGAQVIGPNSQGIVLPGIGRIGCPGGSDPWSRFRPGPIGVVSRSGGMASELSMHIAHWGSGTSVQLHIGGSGLLGTTLAEAVRLADADRNTRRIVVFGEMSSQQEVHLADSIADRPTRADLAVVIVGEAMERSTSDVELGHASRVGTVSDGLTVRQKKNALEAARVTVLDSLADLRRWIVRMTFGPPPQKHQSAELDRQVMRAPESSPEDSHPTQAE